MDIHIEFETSLARVIRNIDTFDEMTVGRFPEAVISMIQEVVPSGHLSGRQHRIQEAERQSCRSMDTSIQSETMPT
jgi:hypothetical protein